MATSTLAPAPKTPARRIYRNRYDNWYGYEGRRRVMAFANSPFFTDEQYANAWLGGRDLDAELATPDPTPAPAPTPAPVVHDRPRITFCPLGVFVEPGRGVPPFWMVGGNPATVLLIIREMDQSYIDDAEFRVTAGDPSFILPEVL